MFSIPGYIISEEIYENSRLKVCRGLRVRDKLPVMIKALKAGANPADIAALVHEYEITRNLDVRGIVKPMRLEWAGLTVALIMGDHGIVTLRKYLRAGLPDVPSFFAIAQQLAETLKELHRIGIIHRNLGMDNIYIDPGTERVKIADFSMAILLSRESQNDFVPFLAGIPAYMSPEQIGRMNRVIDHRSDLYSLGVILYEILTGQLPLQAGDSHMQWAHAHMAKKPVFPGEINPDIPLAISTIIMKLLAKAAGERYQSAAGLLADLEECRRQWSRTGTVNPFTPGQRDLAGLFQLPRRLYGREEEKEIVTSVFKHVCAGQSRLLLVHGYAGTGKTALINETLQPLAAERGYFIAGKFDQLQGNIPYAPFIQALGDLMRQVLTESRESLAAWKKRLLRALGRSGAVITKVIPEVELIVGPQPPVETLRVWESHNRFMMVFRNFIMAFAQKEHPLVIFLDDLQWADSASLGLIRYLSKEPDNRYLLLISAYRDNEVTEKHPLMTTLEELEKGYIPVRQLRLAPLDQANACQFVADTLQSTKEHSQPLADILYRKTGGNPFFLGQLLLSAHEENLLRFNVQGGCLEWDLTAIDEMPMTDDVIELMLAKLRKLPEETLRALRIAASIGNMVDLKTLSFSSEKPPGQLVADLWPAIMEGLVLLVKDTGKTKKRYRIADNYPVVDIENKYEFLHDRVQQAAYSLLIDEEKKETHVKIGRLILVFTAYDLLDERIFTIMDHVNRGLDLIIDHEERIQLAEYNLIAGLKAKAATAYDSALNYFKYGIELLPDNAWDEHYRLTFDLHAEQSQCEYFSANYDTAEQLFNLLLAKAKTDLEKADVYITKILLSSSREEYHETLKLGIKGLSLLGVKLPVNPGIFAFVKEILLAKWRLRNRKTGDVVDLPEMSDPVQKRVMLLLLAQAGAACMVNPALYALIVLKISNLSIKFGNTEFSPIGYAGYSFFTASVLGDYKTGREFELAALKLAEKYDNSLALGIFYFLLGAFVSHWSEHGNTSLKYLQKAVDYGFESGNVLAVSYATNLMAENKYLLGFSLEELYKDCRSYYNRTKSIRLLNYLRLIANLTGRAADSAMNVDGKNEAGGYSKQKMGTQRIPENIPDGILSIGEEELSDLMKGEMNYIVTCSFAKMQLAYLYGDYSGALVIAKKDRQNLKAIRGFMLAAEYIFYYSLAITAEYKKLPKKEQGGYRKILKQNQRRMKKWAESSPENFLHKYLLVAAEIARLDGKESEAMPLYDKSAQSARENGYIQNEALASELAGRLYAARGQDKVAEVYLTEACHSYYRWGASRKVWLLQDQYPHLLARINMEEEPLETAELLKNAFQFTQTGDGESIDELEMHAVRKAMQQLSEETDPQKLLNSFLEMAIEHAGADKGYLILEKDESLYVEAVKESDQRYTAAVNTPVSLEISVSLSRTVVRYVARTLEPVVINDMAQAGLFARDSYLTKSRAKSVVCVPLMFQGIPVGVLYLENSLMPGVFTPERVKVLQFLSGQMAYIQKTQTFLAEDADKVKVQEPLAMMEALTEREMDVLSLIAAGSSNKEIAQRLQLTVNTVKTHILNIYGKLQVNRRVQAIIRAKELKLLRNN